MKTTGANYEAIQDVDLAYDSVKTKYIHEPFKSEAKAHPLSKDLPPMLAKYIIPPELVPIPLPAKVRDQGDVYEKVTPNAKHVKEFQTAAEKVGKVMRGEADKVDDVPAVSANYGLGDFAPPRQLGRPPGRPSKPKYVGDPKEFASSGPPDQLDFQRYEAIIELAKRNGVAKLKFRELELEFFPHTPDYSAPSPKASEDLPNDYDPSQSPASDTKPAVDEALLDDMRRSQLMIDDPMAFEQEMISAHLEDPQ